jgi:hypothetical protein
MLPAGSTLSLSIQHQSSQGYAAILSLVAARLSVDGIRVVDSNVTASGFLDQVLGSLSFSAVPYTVSMRIKTTVDYNEPGDALAVVEHEFYEADNEKNFPTAGCITSITLPDGTIEQTDCQGQTGPGGKAPESSLSDIASNFFDSLKSAGWTLVVAIIGIVVLVLVLVAYSPNVGSAARAAAGAAIL